MAHWPYNGHMADHNEQPISLAPIPFKEAVGDLLKVKPAKKADKLEALDRAGKALERATKRPKLKR